MHRVLKRGITRIEKLDKRQLELGRDADLILQSAKYGQAPPVYHETLNKIISIREQKAKIWNEIRGYIIPGVNKTLWDIAVESGNLPIAQSGKENQLNFYAADLIAAIAAAAGERKREECRT